MFYSIVVPVFNRPDEIQVLLTCLTQQRYTRFEVLVVESGSAVKSDQVVESFRDKLNIRYLLTGNNGQGFSRNVGFKEAIGDYFLVLDSDILLDPDFVENIDKGLKENNLDAHGGPDRCHPSFTDIEKAINYSLTSFFTTGGTRGNKKSVGTYYPRSFNMGFSREVYEATQGFKLPFMGEDIELSARMIRLGFKVGLIENAYVYHHRKTNFAAFYRQMNFFGKARINIYKQMPDTLKPMHFIPLFFVGYLVLMFLMGFAKPSVNSMMRLPLYLMMMGVFIESTFQNRSIKIGLLSILAVFVQLIGYGVGFGEAYWTRVIFHKEEKLENI